MCSVWGCTVRGVEQWVGLNSGWGWICTKDKTNMCVVCVCIGYRGTSVHQPDLLRYGTTKLWTLMCIPEWQQRLGPRGVDVFACHPGLSKSSLFTKYTPVGEDFVSTSWILCTLGVACHGKFCIPCIVMITPETSSPDGCSGMAVCPVGSYHCSTPAPWSPVHALLRNGAHARRQGWKLLWSILHVVLEPRVERWEYVAPYSPRASCNTRPCFMSAGVCSH